MTNCEGITKKGTKCKRSVLPGQKYCRLHNPENDEETKVEDPSIFKRILTIYRIKRSKLQLLFTALFFVFILFISNYTNVFSSTIFIPNDTVKGLLSISSQVLASLAGFFLAFIILVLQYVGSERSKSYDIFREKLEKMSALLMSLPLEFKDIRDDFSSIVDRLDEAAIDEIIITKEDYEKDIIPVLMNISNFSKSSSLSDQANAFYDHFILIFFDIFDITQKNLVPYIGSKVIDSDYAVFPKLVILLILSLLMFLIVGTVDVNNNFPDLIIPIIFTYLFYFILIIEEFYSSIKYLYGNLKNWK